MLTIQLFPVALYSGRTLATGHIDALPKGTLVSATCRNQIVFINVDKGVNKHRYVDTQSNQEIEEDDTMKQTDKG